MEIPSQGLMRCSECGLEKPLSEMSQNARVRNGSWKQCKSCTRNYMAAWRESKRLAYNEYQRNWRKPIREKLNAQGRQRRRDKIAKMTQAELIEFRKAEVNDTRRWNAILKEEVFQAYGGWKCKCCGEDERLFLSIDHVFNDGHKYRKEKAYSRSSVHFYRWLKRKGFPDGFQVLCMNCNFGKRMNNGICPHKQGVTTIPEGSRAERPEAQSTH